MHMGGSMGFSCAAMYDCEDSIKMQQAFTPEPILKAGDRYIAPSELVLHF